MVSDREQLRRWQQLGRDLFAALHAPESLDKGAITARIASLLVYAQTCECGKFFVPYNGEWNRCETCLAAQHAHAERVTGVS